MFNNIPELNKEVSADEPLYMYLIINTDLNMSVGKIGGQIGHAVQYFMEYYNSIGLFNINARCRVKKWNDNSDIAKITLAADTKQFNKIKKEYNPIVVIDKGHTEIQAGSETVICLYPMYKDERSKTLKRLQILKNSDVLDGS